MIPSRNYYPEGFPLTIFEALKSRTPIIASDHPMFRGFLEHRKSAMVFSSGHAEGLANSIRELISHPDLYAGLSANAEQVWQTLQLPVKRHAFFNACVDVWLDKDVSAQKWLYQHRLSSGQYDLTTGRSK
jgi:glycosyltransferase involved in cell wall biosynthesis